MKRTVPWTFPVASILFFCSGALGLGYELIWIRKSALVVGASQIALSTVLTAFFTGLALGAYVVGRYLRSTRWSSLAIYGLFEIAIGIFGLVFPWAFEAVQAAYAALYGPLSGWAPALLALRFALLFSLFVVPTFFMGGTLPLLLDGLVATDWSIGPRTSFLYGVNILGAVAGVLVTSYWAIPALGMNGSSVAGGACNLLLGVLAVALFRNRGPTPAPETAATAGRFLQTAAFASGLLALGYQVLWARYFPLFQLSTVYLTALLLAVYLLSLAAGSFVLAPLLARRWRPLRIIAVLQALVPAAAALALPAWRLSEHRFAIERERDAAGNLRPSATLEIAFDYPRFWHVASETIDAIFLAPLAQIVLVMFVPVLLLGTALPALIAAAARRSADLKPASGRLVFWNTLGASAGSFLAGYALLPLVGLRWSFVVLGLGSLALALALGARDAAEEPIPEPSRRLPRIRPMLLAVAASSLVALLAALVLPEDITRATIRRQQIGRDPAAGRLVAVVEGPLTTAFVTDSDTTIRVGSGAVQMGSIAKGAVSMQVIEGHLPGLFYPGGGAPRDALGICLGSGQSFGALLEHPIDRLDVVEISGEILSLARSLLAPFNNRLAEDPRVRFHLDDGRHFVERAGDASYDLVSMESSPPITDGVYALYSVEFYREVRRILRPGGVFMQFLPLYYLTPDDARSVIKTLAAVFPHTFVARVSVADFMLLSYPERPRFPVSALRERAAILGREWSERGFAPGTWAPESRYPAASFEGVASMLLMGPETIRTLDAPVILRDDRALLSYSTGDRWLARRYLGPTLSHLTFAALPLADFLEMRDYFDPPLSPATCAALAAERTAALRVYGAIDPGEVARRRAEIEQEPDPATRADRAIRLAVDLDQSLRKDDAYRLLGTALEALRDEGRARPEHVQAARAIVRNRIAVYADVAARWIEDLEARAPGAPLIAAMREELEAYRARQARAATHYWLPSRPPG